MAMTIVENARPVTGGVDTHLDAHVAAVLDANGGVLGVESFPANTAGFLELHRWLETFGALAKFSNSRAICSAVMPSKNAVVP